jgi:hypothetical protein
MLRRRLVSPTLHGLEDGVVEHLAARPQEMELTDLPMFIDEEAQFYFALKKEALRRLGEGNAGTTNELRVRDSRLSSLHECPFDNPRRPGRGRLGL